MKMYNVPDLRNKSEEEGIAILKDYNIAIQYVESEVAKDTIIYTEPDANQLVYKNQLIVLYVSAGNREKYKNLKNQIYEDCIGYLDIIKSQYALDIKIKYLEDVNYPDGLIIKQQTKKEYIDYNDELELVIISNSKTVLLPSFFGWHYQEVINFCNKNKINVEFEYIEFLFEADYVVAQSIREGQYVFKQSNPVIIYLAKEN